MVIGGCTPRRLGVRIAVVDQPQAPQCEQLVDLVDRLAERRNRVRQTAGGDEGRLLRQLIVQIADRFRRPGRRSRRRSPTGSPRVVCFPIAASGASRSMRGSLRAARSVSASSEISTPGRSRRRGTRPRSETTSKLIPSAEVDGDAGALHLRSWAATALTRRSAPSLVRVVDQDRHPGLERGSDAGRHRRPGMPLGELLVLGPSGGTTVETIAPSSDPKLSPSRREQVGDRRRQLVGRGAGGGGRGASLAPGARHRRRPGGSGVLPTSTASSIGGIIPAAIGWPAMARGKALT